MQFKAILYPKSAVLVNSLNVSLQLHFLVGYNWFITLHFVVKQCISSSISETLVLWHITPTRARYITVGVANVGERSITAFTREKERERCAVFWYWLIRRAANENSNGQKHFGRETKRNRKEKKRIRKEKDSNKGIWEEKIDSSEKSGDFGRVQKLITTFCINRINSRGLAAY